ncbi:MAG: type II toxin-antitoxin system prevent-host-death family antitoxin [Armatimonadetes bacterium]|nr:type II toxin-antitoxin system prevent-host-death family antitoxin [Armatimonadota bacterium]
MERVTSVSNLKASLSAYLACVKSGEEILVTERGRPIARLVPYLAGPEQEERRLERLYREGILRPGNGRSLSDLLRGRRPARGGASVVEALLAERQEGW